MTDFSEGDRVYSSGQNHQITKVKERKASGDSETVAIQLELFLFESERDKTYTKYGSQTVRVEDSYQIRISTR